MERMKMPRAQRAKQFAPFDALKGLQEALRMKEYLHERVSKGEISEEKANKISKTLLALEKGSVVDVVYFENGHYLPASGKAKLILEEGRLCVGRLTILLENLFDIKIL